MNLRKVIVSRSVLQPPGEFPRYVKEPIGEASFHQFGLGLAEADTSCASYTMAIVEWPDGRVESIDPDHIQFVEPDEVTSETPSPQVKSPHCETCGRYREGP